MNFLDALARRLTSPPADAPLEATPDDVFGLLANERRRLAIHAIAEADGDVVHLGDLATAIACAENDCPPDQLDTKQRKRVYVGLYQAHVDQLADAGAIEVCAREHGANAYRATALTPKLDALARRVERRCTRESEDAAPGTFADVRERVLDDVADVATEVSVDV